MGELWKIALSHTFDRDKLIVACVKINVLRVRLERQGMDVALRGSSEAILFPSKLIKSYLESASIALGNLCP